MLNVLVVFSFQEKYQYRMVGHSGTVPEERLVEWAKPPLTAPRSILPSKMIGLGHCMSL